METYCERCKELDWHPEYIRLDYGSCVCSRDINKWPFEYGKKTEDYLWCKGEYYREQ